MPEAHLSFDRRHLYHAVLVRDLRLRVHDFKYPLCGGDICDDLVVKIAQVHDRVPEHTDIGSECDEGSDGNPVGSKDTNPGKVKGDHAEPPAQVDGGAQRIVDPYCADESGSVLPYQLSEGVLGFPLRREALDHTDSGHVLVHKGVEVGCLFPEDLPALVRKGLDQGEHQRHQRQTAQGRCSQNWILHKHDGGHCGHSHEIRYQCGDKVVQHILQGINVPYDAGQDFSGWPAVKKVKVKCLNMSVKLLAYGDQDAVADLCHHIHTRFHAKDHEKVQYRGKRDQPVQPRAVTL